MLDSILSLIDLTLYNSIGIVFISLGILVSIRFTGFPDLTVDGSFTIGAAIYSILIVKSIPFIFCITISMLVGFLVGCATAFLNKIVGIGQIMSGIIVMILTILLIPYIGAESSIGLIDQNSFFSFINELDREITESINTELNYSYHFAFTAIILCSILFCTFLLFVFFSKTKWGIKIRYSGTAKEPNLISKRERVLNAFIGLGIGNMLISLGGIIEAERRGGFTQNMGQGVLLIGIAILVLGESILKSRKKRIYLNVFESIIAILIGTLIYSLSIQLLLEYANISVDLRLSSTILLLMLLMYSSLKFPNSNQLF